MKRVRVEISPDLLTASLEVLEQAPGSKPLTRADLEEAIRAAGVVHGLLPESLGKILAACARGTTPPAPFPIAEGRSPRPGREASLELLRPLSAGDLTPSEEDDTEQVDHRARGGVTSVEAGELIGYLQPADPGDPGRGVEGTKLGVARLTGPEVGSGANVDWREVDDGKLALVAAMEGILQADELGRPSITDHIEIRGDVDYATGNIEARGSVVVKGGVSSSFRLTSTRDVTVAASVEDAVVEVAGDLTVGKSILGGEEGHVRVGGKLVVGNTQNARVHCTGDLVLQGSDTSSELECDGRFTAIAGRGQLRGGTYTALLGLEARELGSAIGAPTLIRVGLDAAGFEELGRLTAKRAQVAEQADEIRLQLDEVRGAASHDDVTPAHGRRMRELMKQLSELAALHAELAEQRRALIEAAAAVPAPDVRIHGNVHTCVTIELRELKLRFQTDREGVRFLYNAETHRIEVEDL